MNFIISVFICRNSLNRSFACSLETQPMAASTQSAASPSSPADAPHQSPSDSKDAKETPASAAITITVPSAPASAAPLASPASTTTPTDAESDGDAAASKKPEVKGGFRRVPEGLKGQLLIVYCVFTSLIQSVCVFA